MDTLKPICQDLCIINVASQLGAGRNAHGPEWMLRAERIADLLKKSSVRVNRIVHVPEPVTTLDSHRGPVHFLEGVIEVCLKVRQHVTAALDSGLFPVTLGGDHSVAIGSAGAVADFASARHQEAGLFWADAHIDMNTPQTSPSGNLHGMALAVLCGLGHPALLQMTNSRPAFRHNHAAMLGLRFADAAEMRNVMRSGIDWHTGIDIKSNGLMPPLACCLSRVSAATAGFHFSLDLDLLDPLVAPAVNTPCTGGLTSSDALQICAAVAATRKMLSMDLVEYKADSDPEYKLLPLLAELILTSLGK